MISLTREDISRACSSKKFAERLAERSPFIDDANLLKISKEIWWEEVSMHPSLRVSETLASFQIHNLVSVDEHL